MLQDNDIRNEIYLFVAKFVSRIYGIRMINAWLSKKKGSTFFDLMTMSDFAYTVAVLENQLWGLGPTGETRADVYDTVEGVC